jgi:hypothetical protein
VRTPIRLAPVTIVLAVGLMTPTARAVGNDTAARVATSCPNIIFTYPSGLRATRRVVLHGRVSCAEAMRVIRVWRAHPCRSRICPPQAGGWICSYLSSVEIKDSGGLLTGGCYRPPFHRGPFFDIDKLSASAAEKPPGTDAVAAVVPGPPRPVFDRTATVQTVSGTVFVKTPSSANFTPLTSPAGVPMGTTIDTTNGTVQLTSANANGRTESGRFYSGVFKLTQTKTRSRLKRHRVVSVTVLSLGGGPSIGCAAGGAPVFASGAAASGRRLWGDAHGNFRTRGRYASATVRGTRWLIEDTCAGTLVKVARGVVAVEDLRTHKTVLVPAGKSLLSKSGATGATELTARLAAGTVNCGLTFSEFEHKTVHFLLCVGLLPQPNGTNPLRQWAKLEADGHATTCVDKVSELANCLASVNGAARGVPGYGANVVPPGTTLALGIYVCKVSEAGVECNIPATGKGFSITPNAVTAIGA